jgi:hypothetical protein
VKGLELVVVQDHNTGDEVAPSTCRPVSEKCRQFPIVLSSWIQVKFCKNLAFQTILLTEPIVEKTARERCEPKGVPKKVSANALAISRHVAATCTCGV